MRYTATAKPLLISESDRVKENCIVLETRLLTLVTLDLVVIYCIAHNLITACVSNITQLLLLLLLQAKNSHKHVYDKFAKEIQLTSSL